MMKHYLTLNVVSICKSTLWILVSMLGHSAFFCNSASISWPCGGFTALRLAEILICLYGGCTINIQFKRRAKDLHIMRRMCRICQLEPGKHLLIQTTRTSIESLNQSGDYWIKTPCREEAQEWTEFSENPHESFQLDCSPFLFELRTWTSCWWPLAMSAGRGL